MTLEILANARVYRDEAGTWCVQQDRRLALFLVGYAVLGGAVFFLVPPPLQYAVHGGILAAALGTMAAFTRHENRTATLAEEDAGLRIGEERVPWARIRGITAARVEIRTVLSERGGELGALVVDIDGTPRPLVTRAPVEALEPLVESLRAHLS